jgi:hypothetical protein
MACLQILPRVASRNARSRPLCQEALWDFFPTGSGPLAALGAATGRMVGTGLGVACPNSWRLGCEPAALETEPFPLCPPRPAFICSALRAASATK